MGEQFVSTAHQSRTIPVTNRYQLTTGRVNFRLRATAPKLAWLLTQAPHCISPAHQNTKADLMKRHAPSPQHQPQDKGNAHGQGSHHEKPQWLLLAHSRGEQGSLHHPPLRALNSIFEQPKSAAMQSLQACGKKHDFSANQTQPQILRCPLER